MLVNQPDHMKSVCNYACIGKPLSNQPPIGRIHVDADLFNFVPTLQRLQKIAHIAGAAPLNHVKDSAAGQVAKRGRKDLSARKSVLINAQNARACAVCPVAALVLHHLVVVPLQLAELLFKGLYVGFADFNCLLPRGVVYSYAVIGKMYFTG